MKWNSEKIAKYQEFARVYVAAYSQKIDCADLAIAALVDFAKKEGLPIRFKYYDKSWRWVAFDPANDDAQEFKKRAMVMFGALNVIDNTKGIPIAAARPGDFIMSKWNNSLGHTRVIHSITPIQNKFKVVWYQGNLPPVKPERKEDFFSNIGSVYGQQPRRWNFEQFEH